MGRFCTVYGESCIYAFQCDLHISVREGANVEACQRQMQEHQVRRIPIVDAEDRVIGIVSQADLTLRDKCERVSTTIAEISKPEQSSMAACLEPTAAIAPPWLLIHHDTEYRACRSSFVPPCQEIVITKALSSNASTW